MGEESGKHGGRVGLSRAISYLVFTEQGKVKYNLQWLSISSHYDELRDTSVERLGSCTVHNNDILIT